MTSSCLLVWFRVSDITDNAGTQNLDLYDHAFDMDITHTFYLDSCIWYPDNRELETCITDRYIMMYFNTTMLYRYMYYFMAIKNNDLFQKKNVISLLFGSIHSFWVLARTASKKCENRVLWKQQKLNTEIFIA